MTKKSLTFVALGSLLVLPVVTLASQPVAASSGGNQMEGSTTINVNQNIVRVSGRVSLGMLVGEANEFVYDGSPAGNKVSQLEWQMDSVAMLGIGGSVTPTHWLKLNADVWFNISEGSGEMDDYDWYVPGMDWTHWSHHESMDVDGLALFDINAEFDFYETTTSRFYGIAGYKHDKFEWSATGGSYTYSVNGFRDTVGTFDSGQQVISYEQTYDAPYIGIGIEADIHPIQISARAIYSSLVQLEAVDNHYLRNLEFTDDFEDGDLFGINLTASYRLNPQMLVAGSFIYQSYDEVKGSTTVKDVTTGATSQYDGDVAGADNTTSMFTASFIYEF